MPDSDSRSNRTATRVGWGVSAVAVAFGGIGILERHPAGWLLIVGDLCVGLGLLVLSGLAVEWVQSRRIRYQFQMQGLHGGSARLILRRADGGEIGYALCQVFGHRKVPVGESTELRSGSSIWYDYPEDFGAAARGKPLPLGRYRADWYVSTRGSQPFAQFKGRHVAKARFTVTPEMKRAAEAKIESQKYRTTCRQLEDGHWRLSLERGIGVSLGNCIVAGPAGESRDTNSPAWDSRGVHLTYPRDFDERAPVLPLAEGAYVVKWTQAYFGNVGGAYKGETLVAEAHFAITPLDVQEGPTA